MSKKKVTTFVTVKLTFVEVGDEKDMTPMTDAHMKEQLGYLVDELVDMFELDAAVVLDAQTLVEDADEEEW